LATFEARNETSYIALMCCPEELNCAVAGQQLERLKKFRKIRVNCDIFGHPLSRWDYCAPCRG
jgi:hypothetical protein